MAGAVSLASGIALGIQVSNLLGLMKWEGAKYTEGLINTNTVVIDEQGYLTYAPSVSGNEAPGDILEIPERILRVAFGLVRPSLETGIALTFDALGISPSAWLRINTMSRNNIEIGCGRALSGRLAFRIAVIHQGWHISIISDALEPSQANTLGVGLECKLGF